MMFVEKQTDDERETADDTDVMIMAAQETVVDEKAEAIAHASLEEDVSTASMSSNVSPLSPVFAAADQVDLLAPLPLSNDSNQQQQDDENDGSGLFMEEEQETELFLQQHQNSNQQHHRRLPSTIYEESNMSSSMADSAPVETTRLAPSRLSSSSLSNKSNSLSSLQQQQQPDAPPPTASWLQLSPERMPPKTHYYPTTASPPRPPPLYFTPWFVSTRCIHSISYYILPQSTRTPFYTSVWLGFWALLLVTCVNYVLTPLRDAIALAVGVEMLPMLTLISTALAFLSSVPIGWLFEAPDPARRKVWKKMGLTRGQTQGSSLALFYRCFAWFLLVFVVGLTVLEWLQGSTTTTETAAAEMQRELLEQDPAVSSSSFFSWQRVVSAWYICFFLVVHLMKLHSLSLIWGVTTEAMEYEEVARKKLVVDTQTASSQSTRLQQLALVGFGGTVGGILGSGLASSMAHILKLPGLLLLAAILLEVSAELSVELGRVMQKHWEEQQIFQSSNDLTNLDPSMRRSVSVEAMKRISSGNSLNHMKRVSSSNSLNRVHSQSELNPGLKSSGSLSNLAGNGPGGSGPNEDSFFQRLLRGVTTILRSRLLMAIFTYNALYASTTVLLSFQRAALISSRSGAAAIATNTEADTAFLAKVNMASSLAIFGLQATGLGAYLAHSCGPRGTLSLMPLVRLAGVLALAWWHRTSNGQPPNLLIFLIVDECCKIMNLAVAKPVRESLWRGLSNEARYEAKPIVDTLANRWGGGSAAFLVSFLSKCLDLLNVEPGPDGVRTLFGFPPILLLCMIISAWWTVVSADLGYIRSRIDLELKKMQ